MSSKLFRIMLLTFGSVLVLCLCSCVSNPDNTPENTPEDLSTTPPEQALLLHTIGGGKSGIVLQELVKDATTDVKTIDGATIRLNETQVGTDEIDREELYIVFESGALPGYYVFVCTPGETLGSATGILEVDYSAMKQSTGVQTFELRYRTNKAFQIHMFYTRYPRFKELSSRLPTYKRSVFYAYPVNLPSSNEELRIEENNADNNWYTESFEISPSTEKLVEMVDIAEQYLERLDEAWRYVESEVMFEWSEQKISEESANIIAQEFGNTRYEPSVRYLKYGNTALQMAETSPVLTETVLVVDGNGERLPGQISISVTEREEGS